MSTMDVQRCAEEIMDVASGHEDSVLGDVYEAVNLYLAGHLTLPEAVRLATAGTGWSLHVDPMPTLAPDARCACGGHKPTCTCEYGVLARLEPVVKFGRTHRQLDAEYRPQGR